MKLDDGVRSIVERQSVPPRPASTMGLWRLAVLDQRSLLVIGAVMIAAFIGGVAATGGSEGFVFGGLFLVVLPVFATWFWVADVLRTIRAAKVGVLKTARVREGRDLEAPQAAARRIKVSARVDAYDAETTFIAALHPWAREVAEGDSVLVLADPEEERVLFWIGPPAS